MAGIIWQNCINAIGRILSSLPILCLKRYMVISLRRHRRRWKGKRSLRRRSGKSWKRKRNLNKNMDEQIEEKKEEVLMSDDDNQSSSSLLLPQLIEEASTEEVVIDENPKNI